MTPIALSNAVASTLTDNAFFRDLAAAVSNDGNPDTAAAWLWALLDCDDFNSVAWLERNLFIEGLVKAWPVMQMACEMFNYPAPAMARFVAERIPAAMQEEVALPHVTPDKRWSDGWFAPVTVAVVLADRAHDLAGLFSAGCKPNGSKDPYALRRAAKHFIVASAMLPSMEYAQ